LADSPEFKAVAEILVGISRQAAVGEVLVALGSLALIGSSGKAVLLVSAARTDVQLVTGEFLHTISIKKSKERV